MPLPLEVRWNSLADSIRAYLDNWTVLFAVCENHRDGIDQDVARKVQDRAIKRNCEDYLQRLIPISIALDKMQVADCTIADAVEVWKDLEAALSDVLSNPREKTALKKRIAANLKPCHYLANLLSPNYHGRRLTSEEVDAALGYCSTNHPTCLSTVMNYQTKTAPFSDFRFKPSLVANVSPLVWWKSITGMSEEVLTLVAPLLTAVNSSASIERVFSTFGLVHSRLRNRLGVEKAGKLVFIYRILNCVSIDSEL